MKTPDPPLRLSVLDERLAVCRLDAASDIPSWADSNGFTSFTRTKDELSVVCSEGDVPEDIACEKGWRAFQLEGPLDFSLIGVLAGIMGILAEEDVSVFVISTYDTDYVLVREEALERATSALRRAGHEVREANTNIIVRLATADDEPFLWEMLYEAVYWSPEETGPKPPLQELLSEPGLRRYIEGWGRKNDTAVIALCRKYGEKVGAAWYRIFSDEEPGYGFVHEATPEIAIAVAPDLRGAGVGSGLLGALMNAARSGGFDALSLGVQKSNQAAVKLYEGKDFVRLRDEGDEWIMKAELSAGEKTDTKQMEVRCR